MYWTPKETRPLHLDVQIKGVTEPAETGGVPLVRMLSTHPSLLSRLGSRRGVTALRDPAVRTSCFLGRLLEPPLLPFFRFCSCARESPFGEVPAVGRTIWGGEEDAGPCHLYRNGSQPLQPVCRQHHREIPRQEWPPDDAARGLQGICHISQAPVLLLLPCCIFKCCKVRWLDGITTSMDMSFEQTPGDGVGLGSLAGCSSWGHKESDVT